MQQYAMATETQVPLCLDNAKAWKHNECAGHITSRHLSFKWYDQHASILVAYLRTVFRKCVAQNIASMVIVEACYMNAVGHTFLLHQADRQH